MSLQKSENKYVLYYIAATIFVLITGVATSSSAYLKYDSIQKAAITSQTSMSASALDQTRILKLTGTEKDLTSPDYLYLKDKLAKIRAANKDIRFVYLAGYRDNEPFFFVDSEPDNSPNSSPPGEIYTEAKPSFIMPFSTKKPLIEGIYPDRWGVWLTALSPIFDPIQPDKVIAELGMDIDASNRTINLLMNSSPPLFLAIFVATLIILGLMAKKHEKDLQHLREDFISMIVHDLRSPLSNVMNLLELMDEGILKPGNKDYREMTKMVSENTGGMLELINDLLDAAKLEAGKFDIHREPTNIKKIVEDRIRFFELAAQEVKITLKAVFAPNLPKVISLDPARISRVLNNFISNALKFTKAGGTVTVQIMVHNKGKNLVKESSKAHIKWLINGNEKKWSDLEKSLIIAVTDSGSAIAKEDLSHLFNKFKQSQSHTSIQKGTGLGLWIVKGIIEAHDGIVGVASGEEFGNTFYGTIKL